MKTYPNALLQATRSSLSQPQLTKKLYNWIKKEVKDNTEYDEAVYYFKTLDGHIIARGVQLTSPNTYKQTRDSIISKWNNERHETDACLWLFITSGADVEYITNHAGDKEWQRLSN